jgi:Bifunctional DNA primase/polymerase, N-terminal
MYLARGWPLLVCQPRGKAPIGELVPHGVHDATTDLAVIAGWLRECPDANLAVACGAPGPQVLDIDDPSRVPPPVAAALRAAPRAASARGGQGYFAGTDAGTVNLGYGELRGRGSYQLVPPSTHPTGRPYRWIVEPRGPLLSPPTVLERLGRRAGRGDHEAPVERVPHGQRHPYLKDFAVHLARGAILDRRVIAWHLRCEFERVCEPLPPPKPGYFEALADSAAGSRIAERERQRELADLAALIRKRQKERP